ncbi:MAG: 6-pyruvoyl tetrahydropterin synthase family protein [Euryarchaeota archaeon]|nr:6-pyruvoyl tetrahydropterin synthase family protein [Euryarchaeota archaeon]
MKIVLDGWRLGLRFSACHLIVEHEKCGRLHGHTYTLNVLIEGDRDEKYGFVVDFIEVKALIRSLMEEVDHRVLMPGLNENVRIEERDGEVEVMVLDKRYVFPSSDVVFLPIRSLSAEDLAGYFLQRIREGLSRYKNIHAIEVGVDEGAGQGVRVRAEV